MCVAATLQRYSDSTVTWPRGGDSALMPIKTVSHNGTVSKKQARKIRQFASVHEING